MKICDCKIGAKIWYHPDQTDMSKRIAGVITYGPDYMYGDYACMISSKESVPQWINVNLLSLRTE